MKTIGLLLSLLLVSSVFSNTQFANNDSQLVAEFAEIARDYISSGRKYPLGYKVGKIAAPIRYKKPFLRFLNQKELELEKLIRDHVDAAPEEYGDKAADAKQNPRKYLKVPYLFEISEIYKIYKDSRFIGYAIDCDNHADAQIIQDGSWSIVYLDRDMNVIAEKAGQA